MESVVEGYKAVCYHKAAYSMEPYFGSLNFPNLVMGKEILVFQPGTPFGNVTHCNTVMHKL